MKAAKKLKLKKETVRFLESAEMLLVVGGTDTTDGTFRECDPH